MHIKCMIKVIVLKRACNSVLLVRTQTDTNWDAYKLFDKSDCLEKGVQFNIVGQNTPRLFDENPQKVDSINIHANNFVEKDVLLTGLSSYNITFLLNNKKSNL